MIQIVAYLTSLLTQVLLCASSAVFAIIFVNKLSKEGEILGFIRQFAYDMIDRMASRNVVFDQNHYNRLAKFLYPVFECSLCLAGQVSFYSYIFNFWGDYSIINHIMIVVWTIYLTNILQKLWIKE